MNIIFMGTPEFAVPCLNSLIDNNYNIISVITQPDKPKGRRYTLTSPPVKILANNYNIPVYQPVNIKSDDVYNKLIELNPDIIIVVAYGQILTESILSIPKLGCINVHASLLPKYRGASPIQTARLNGEKITGVTTMYMEKGLDAGDIILKKETNIDENETASELHDRLSIIGSKLLIDTLKNIENNIIIRHPQDDSLSSYAPILSKSMSTIDFSKSIEEVHNHIMGLSTWPCANTIFNNKILKVYRSKKIYDITPSNFGEFIDNKKFIISCRDGCIEFLEVQYQGSKKMSGEDFLRGRKVNIGDTIVK